MTLTLEMVNGYICCQNVILKNNFISIKCTQFFMSNVFSYKIICIRMIQQKLARFFFITGLLSYKQCLQVHYTVQNFKGKDVSLNFTVIIVQKYSISNSVGYRNKVVQKQQIGNKSFDTFHTSPSSYQLPQQDTTEKLSVTD